MMLQRSSTASTPLGQGRQQGLSPLRLLSSVARSTPILEAISWLYAHRPRILLYHRFDVRSSSRRLGVDLFEAEVKLISDRFTPLTVTGLLDAIASRRSVRNAVVITIDDGYADVHEHAFPILRHYAVPATMYVTAGFVEGALWLWPDVIAYALQSTVVANYRCAELGESLPLRTQDERDRAWSVLATFAESLRSEELQPWVQSLARSLGVAMEATPVDGYRAMSWAMPESKSAVTHGRIHHSRGATPQNSNGS
jgi:hypothetical protein